MTHCAIVLRLLVFAMLCTGSLALAEPGELENVPGTSAKVGALTMPSTDGRILFGELFTKEEKAATYERDLDKRRVSQDTYQQRHSMIEDRTKAFAALLDLASDKNIVSDLAAAYDSDGINIDADLKRRQAMLLDAALVQLPFAELEPYIENLRESEYNLMKGSSLRWKGEDEFAKVHTAKSFLDNETPALVKAAPPLPLKIRQVRLVKLPDYDVKSQSFEFRNFEKEPLTAMTLSSAEIDLRLRMEPAEAEALVKACDGPAPIDRHAYLIEDSTLLARSDHPASTGVPVNHVEAVFLAADPLGGEKLTELRFTQQPVSVTEGGNTAVQPDGPLVINQDSMLVLLLKSIPGIAEHVQWDRACQERFGIDFRKDPDPYGRFAPTMNTRDMSEFANAIGVREKQIEAYRQWTLARAEALPEKHPLALHSNYANTVNIDSNNEYQALHAGDINTGPSGDRNGLIRDLKNMNLELKGGVAALLKNGLSGLDNTRVSFVIRGDEKDDATWKIPWDDARTDELRQIIESLPPGERHEQDSYTDFDINQTLVIGKPGEKIRLVIELTPKSTRQSVAGVVVASREWNAADFQPAIVKPASESDENPADPLAPETIPSAPYGPEMVGLQLGMDMTTALKMAREKFTDPMEVVFHADPGKKTPFRQHHVIMDSKTFEAICLVPDPRKGKNKLIGMTRFVPKRTKEDMPIEAVMTSLMSKYGDPVKSDSEGAKWFQDYGGGEAGRERIGYQKISNVDGKEIDQKDLPWPLIAFRKDLPGLGFNLSYVNDGKNPVTSYKNHQPGFVFKYDPRMLTDYNAAKKLGMDSNDVVSAKFFLMDMKAAAAIYKQWQEHHLKEQSGKEIDLDL